MHWVAAIFKRLQCRYLSKWTSQIDGIEQSAIREWSIGLDGLSGEQIAKGLKTWNAAWPPSMDEFRAACLGMRSGINDYGLDFVPEYYRASPQMDKSRLLSRDERLARREKNKFEIEKIKRALRGFMKL